MPGRRAAGAVPVPSDRRALLARARGGDGDAFRRLAEPHIPALRRHCAHILGSAHDGEEALQESLLRAWQRLPGFEARGSFRSWLFSIATNTSLNALAARSRRPRAGHEEAPESPAPGPEAGVEEREQLELALRALVSRLPPRQRAAVVLREGLGWSAPEIAELLGTSAAAVNSSLQRARATLEQGEVAATELDDLENALVARYLRAWRDQDVRELVRLLRTDAARTSLVRALHPVGGGWLRLELRGDGDRPAAVIPARFP